MATPSPPKLFNLAIVGGGISGLILAIGLRKLDIPITIYESAAKFGEIGAGLGFTGPSVIAMNSIDPRMKEGLMRLATKNGSKAKEDVWFTVRVGDLRKAGENGVVKGKEEVGLRIGEPAFEVVLSEGTERGAVHRAHFLNMLLELIPDDITRLGKRLVDLSYAETGDVNLHFADGTTAQHTAVIGCDGIKSKTREILLREYDPDAAKAVFSGKYVYRGLIPMSQAVEMLGVEEATNSQIYLGYHGHVLTLPIEKGKTMNVVAFKTHDSWTNPNWVVPASKDNMIADYAEWGPSVKRIISAMQKPDIWALFNHPPARTYYKDRVCLLGDAAHASTPHQGSGAGFCVEDCYVMCGLMKEARSVEDLEKVFRAFDEVRRPRTQKLVETSREAGMLYEFELEEGDDVDAIQRNMQARMEWIWKADIPAELERAIKIFRGD
ncbi:mannitol 1-phosphate dehydrogenase [Delitschia confertaspora ATCC 74209]|uniref:Mannitol 1-phosphate dehydrogenase n=1 Tax=Delitschia confertaspora ATCC 74209 TaxID=1513339 RepID=A0A9P4JHK7_9PLEO|nr:mannitol 1-phosphate dehydrogenase [Delitschia confertaspora ATCC 74209]